MSFATGNAPAPAASSAARPASGPAVDPLRVIGALVRGWKTVLLGGLVFCGLGYGVGRLKFGAVYTATASLMRQEAAGTYRVAETADSVKPRQLSTPTVVSLMKSPTLLQRVSTQTRPALTARAIAGGLTITPERNTDLIHVSFQSTRSPQNAVGTLNLIGAEVVRLTRDMQVQEAANANKFLKDQLHKADEDLREVNQQLLTFVNEAGLIDADRELDSDLRLLDDFNRRAENLRLDLESLDLRVRALETELAHHNPIAERLLTAQDRLKDLQQRLGETNGVVAQQISQVAILEQELNGVFSKANIPREGEIGIAAAFYKDLVPLQSHRAVLADDFEKTKSAREALSAKLRTRPQQRLEYARLRARRQSLESAQALLASRQRETQFYEENPPGYYRYFEAKLEDVETSGRRKKWLFAAIAGGILGVFGGAGLVGLREVLDDRLKTVGDIRRVSPLPLLATLPNLATLDAAAQAHWATRAWPVLRSELAPGEDAGIVCGIGAASRGEGCSTWLRLLAAAASERGGPVLALADQAPADAPVIPLDQALAAPAAITGRLGVTTWLVPPAGWSWEADQRRQLQAALAQWRRVARQVVLVKLPSADQPAALLLAEAVQDIFWLVRSGMATGPVTANHLATYRAAGCRFAGLLFNCPAGRFGA